MQDDFKEMWKIDAGRDEKWGHGGGMKNSVTVG